MPDSKYVSIQQALITLTPLSVFYDGFTRDVCPHSLGKKHGGTSVLMYQFGGGSHKGLSADGSPNNWRCMYLSGISILALTPGPWHTAPDHTQPNN